VNIIKKQLLIGGAIFSLGVASLAGVGLASAQGQGGDHDSLVSKIATKFNLNKDQVQKVFDEEHEAKHAERDKQIQDKITQAVKDGKITKDQANKLTAKHEEMEKFMESLKGKTSEERREAMNTKRDEMKKWMEDNNIPNNLLGFGKQGKGMMRGGQGGQHVE
jgi:polyhydroxyalkanoate synthesis regulator phasin